MHVRDAATALGLLCVSGQAAAQEVEVRLMVGRYEPQAAIVEDAVSPSGLIGSAEHTSSMVAVAAVDLWWTAWFGTAVTASLAHPQYHSWSAEQIVYPREPFPPYTEPARDFSAGLTLTQLSAKALVRVLRKQGLSVNASAGVAYLHWGGWYDFLNDRSTWAPTAGMDVAQQITQGIGVVLSATYLTYEFLEAPLRQHDVALAAGLKFKVAQ